MKSAPLLLSALVALVMSAGCGGMNRHPITVTNIPYGTITVPNKHVGSFFRCKGGQSITVLNGGFKGGVGDGGIRLWERHHHVLITCMRH